ncbi:CPBP family intramembrane glutamic endopeptidase [Natrialba asiatica]|uniref:Abortive infection protein n=1 Tax=Natrialba asiatica (strain ATCC 700177 / DSM 12278 / JCM 9576 / FERM P-10747 / NBRC 102637 / 172P1) TaxID=29540 RepID=M0AL16_NATA1|nr:type II CAAX endopeptidase family protein [Natrialba asiatica]ELY99249.1 abortive infection protein [Natrialba asiatica DSM 12278]
MSGDAQQESQLPPLSRSGDEDASNSNAAGRRSPLTFFALVFALSIPFGVVGIVTGIQLFPGIPVTALGGFCPAIAAAILLYRENGIAAVTQLLRRSVDYKHIRAKIWYIPIVVLLPGVVIVRYGLMRLLELPHPPPQFSVVTVLVMFGAFVVFALGEELGWSGYVIDSMQERWGALHASVLLGVVWAMWHLPVMVQLGQSSALIALGCLNMVGVRVLFVWLYNNTGKSVFAIVLCHAILNVTTKTLFPGGSFDTGLIDTCSSPS